VRKSAGWLGSALAWTCSRRRRGTTRTLVDRDPRAALALLERLASTQPRGYLVEERAALSVLALAADGQRDLAKLRATTFLRRYPDSPFADRVRAARAALAPMER
jgi:outer membrane protein assembly factor BamD (BamD/ComL family)